MATFEPGSLGTNVNTSFVATWQAVKPDKYPELIQGYGRQLLDLFDIFDLKTPTTSQRYSHFEEDRIYPKVSVTTAGAGAGVTATFTVASNSQMAYTYNNQPYDTSVSSSFTAMPVRVGDILQIKPSSGTVSAGSYIDVYVLSVNTGAGTFTAQPTDSTLSVPAIAAAQEIILIGTGFGEGSDSPAGRANRSTEYFNNTQIFKWTKTYTGTSLCEKKWYTDPRTGSSYYTIKGEDAQWVNFRNSVSLGLLLGKNLSNTSLSTTLAAANTPIATTQGVIPTILDRGNTFNYSSITGLTLSDMEQITLTLDKQKGSLENIMYNGLNLDMQLDRELGDRFKNGGISYGMFKLSEDKKVSLRFKTFQIGNRTYHKQVLDTLNDEQTLGADGFGYPHESMILPMESTIDPSNGTKVAPIRKRVLYKGGTESQEYFTSHWDGRNQGDSGTDREEIRYGSYCGVEMFAVNRCYYIKRA